MKKESYQNTRRTGAVYERKAGAYLEKYGYKILEYNYRCRQGEVDIIARDGEYLVFCEVKYRSGTGSGYPEEAVDLRKQKKISKCALYYLTVHGLVDVPVRFDVVSIEGEQFRLYQNAFDYGE